MPQDRPNVPKHVPEVPIPSTGFKTEEGLVKGWPPCHNDFLKKANPNRPREQNTDLSGTNLSASKSVEGQFSMALSRRKRPQMTAGEGILVRGPLEDRLFVDIIYTLYIPVQITVQIHVCLHLIQVSGTEFPCILSSVSGE